MGGRKVMEEKRLRDEGTELKDSADKSMCDLYIHRYHYGFTSTSGDNYYCKAK